MLADQKAKTSVRCAPALNSYNEDGAFSTMAMVSRRGGLVDWWWIDGFFRGDDTTES